MGVAFFSGVQLRVAADMEAASNLLGEWREGEAASLGLDGEEKVGKEGRSPSSLCSEV